MKFFNWGRKKEEEEDEEKQDNLNTEVRIIPRVFMESKDWQRLLYYAKAAGQDEIMGYGKVRRDGNDFYISNVFIVGQHVSGVSAEASEETAEFVLELAKKNENPADYRFCWHSHVDMGAFWSGDDDETSTGFNNEYMINMVLNKRGEYKIRIDIFEPVAVTLYNVPFQLNLAEDNKLKQEVEKEVKEKLEKDRPAYTSPADQTDTNWQADCGGYGNTGLTRGTDKTGKKDEKKEKTGAETSKKKTKPTKGGRNGKK